MVGAVLLFLAPSQGLVKKASYLYEKKKKMDYRQLGRRTHTTKYRWMSSTPYTHTRMGSPAAT